MLLFMCLFSQFAQASWVFPDKDVDFTVVSSVYLFDSSCSSSPPNTDQHTYTNTGLELQVPGLSANEQLLALFSAESFPECPASLPELWGNLSVVVNIIHCDTSDQPQVTRCLTSPLTLFHRGLPFAGMTLTEKVSTVHTQAHHFWSRGLSLEDCSSKCASCTDSVCSYCLSGYFLVDNDCVACSSALLHCETCNSLGTECVCCQEGYFVDNYTCYECQSRLPSCAICDHNGSVCLECRNGFYLKNNECVECSDKWPDCVSCSTEYCNECEPQHFLKFNQCRDCSVNLPNCKTCDKYGEQCTECNDGYYLDGAHCALCSDALSNCQECHQSGTACFVCKSGYFLSDGMCHLCDSLVSHCIECEDECSACEPEYVLEDNECLHCTEVIAHCDACHPDGTCSSCQVGYFLDVHGHCKPCHNTFTSCVACNEQECTDCGAGYFLQNGACIHCSTAIEACLECSNHFSCTLCGEGYYVNNGQCTECSSVMPHCLTCSDEGSCSSCESGYFPASCGQCRACDLSIANCLACEDSKTCSDCADSHFINEDGQCSQCFMENPHCVECLDTSECIVCAFGYYLEAGQCRSCLSIPNCSKCSDESTCLECEDTYYLSDGQCIECRTLPNCVDCEDSETCSVCVDGFYPENGQCQVCSEACHECSGPNTCTSCPYGYFLDETKCLACFNAFSDCVDCSETQCSECSSGYYLSGGACLPCHPALPNCGVCSQDGLQCHDCHKGYYLDLDSCHICINKHNHCLDCTMHDCLECDQGYFLKEGKCEPCTLLDQFCTECSPDSCTHCETNFLLVSGQCTKCEELNPFCEECDLSGNCLSCMEHYFLNDLGCAPCSEAIEHCQTCTDDGQTCEECQKQYQLQNNECWLCTDLVTNCDLCTETGTCSECARGYFLQGNECLPCSHSVEYCLECTGTGSLCTRCEENFIVSGGECKSCSMFIENCLECSNAYTCETCIPHHFVEDGQCLHCSKSLSHCQDCVTPSHCLACEPGYFTSLTGECELCSDHIPYCLECSDESTCTNCESNYFVDTIDWQCTQCKDATPHCLSCLDTGECQECESGYFLDGEQCHPCSTSSCKHCNDSDECTLCHELHYLTATKECNACSELPHCSLCTYSGICTVCMEGYYLDEFGSCQICSLEHCVDCTDSTHCSQCEDGFFPNESSMCEPCNSVLDNCEECSANGLRCTECDDGFFINDKHCIPCNNAVKYCVACDQTGENCFECEAGLYLASNRCWSCSGLHLHCHHCSVDRCLSCRQGYFLQDGLCTACSSLTLHCSSCNESKCYSCESGYILSQNTCVACDVFNLNCEQCFDNGNCKSCKEGYFLSNGVCLPCSQAKEHCLSCSNTGTTCNECVDGYFLHKNECKLCWSKLPDCKVCDQSGTYCFECNPQYFLNSYGGCSPCSYLSEGCTDCLQIDEQCVECEEGYFLADGECFKCDGSFIHCISCDQSGCDQCEESYVLDSDGECKDCNQVFEWCLTCGQSTCDACIDEYTLVNGECLPCSSNCRVCSEPSSCEICYPGFYLTDSNTCSTCSTITRCEECANSNSCTRCTEGYVLVNGHCLDCSELDPLCVECSSEGLCTDCSYGYYPIGSSCHSCNLDHCLDCAVQNVCAVCADGYFNEQGLCVKCGEEVSECIRCQPDGTCIECDYGHFLALNDTCVSCSCIPHCIGCAGCEECTQCGDGYYLTDTHACDPCDSAISHCLTCSAFGEYCMECEDEFDLVDKQCQPKCEHANCLSCNLHNECVACYSEYFLDDTGICIACGVHLDHCLECANEHNCTLCEAHFYLDQDSKCANCTEAIPHCELCSQDGSICHNCRTGYELIAGVCQSSCNYEHCTACDLSHNCLECSYGYFLESNTNCGLCSHFLPNCLACNSSLVCDDCEEGYYKGSSQNCTRCDTNFPHCELCSELGDSCFECENGYILRDEQCVEFCSYPHCLYCDYQDECLHCDTGYYLHNPHECRHCDLALPGCLQCIDQTTCEVCDYGYYLHENEYCQQCSHALPFCLECSEDGSSCLTCQSGYILKDHQCIEECNYEYCMQCNSDDECTMCERGYYLSDHSLPSCQLCSTAIEHCQVCSDALTCSECDDHYVVSQGICTQCRNYFHPSQLQAFFGENFAKVYILFDEDNANRSQNCNDIFQNEYLALLGEQPKCFWSGKRELVVILGKNYALRNEHLQLRSQYLWKPSGECRLDWDDLEPLCEYRFGVPIPQVVIKGGSQYNMDCTATPLILRAIAEQGGCRGELTYRWSITNSTSMNEILGQITTPTLALEAGELEEGHWNFRVEVTNSLDQVGTAEFLVEILANSGLTVLIDSGSEYILKYSHSHTFQAYVEEFCDQSGPLTFQWTYSGTSSGIEPVDSSPATVLTNSPKASLLAVRAHDLSVGFTYLYTVHATVGALSGSSTLMLTVVASELVAYINNSPGLISSQTDLVLDGTGSYDPDDPAALLNYEWTCAESLSSCLAADGSLLITNHTESTLTIEHGRLREGAVYVFTLQVSMDERTASASVELEVHNRPEFLIKNEAQFAKCNPETDLLLELQIFASNYSHIEWKQSYGHSLIPTSPGSYPIIRFEGGTMLPGTAYEFDCYLWFDEHESAHASISWVTNVGPECSGLIVSPTVGYAFQTEFSLSLDGCFDGDDEDYPLLYSFGIELDSRRTPIVDQSLSDSVKVKLPYGELLLYGVVCDALDTCQYYSTVVSVTSDIRREEVYVLDQLEEDTRNEAMIPAYSLLYALEYDLTPEECDSIFITLEEFAVTTELDTVLVSSILGGIVTLLDCANFSLESDSREWMELVSSIVAQTSAPLPEDLERVFNIVSALLIADPDLFADALAIMELLASASTQSYVPDDLPFSFIQESFGVHSERLLGEHTLGKVVDFGNTLVTLPDDPLFDSSNIINLKLAYFEDFTAESGLVDLTFTTSGTLDGLLYDPEVEELVELRDLAMPINISLPCNISQIEAFSCVYYDDGEWIDEGCELVAIDGNTCTLQAYHTSIFSVRAVDDLSIECDRGFLVIEIILVVAVLCAVVLCCTWKLSETKRVPRKVLPLDPEEVFQTEPAQEAAQHPKNEPQSDVMETEIEDDPNISNWVRFSYYHIFLSFPQHRRHARALSWLVLVLTHFATLGIALNITEDTENPDEGIELEEYMLLVLAPLGTSLAFVGLVEFLNETSVVSRLAACIRIVVVPLLVVLNTLLILLVTLKSCSEWDALWALLGCISILLDIVVLRTLIALFRLCYFYHSCCSNGELNITA